MPRLISPTAIVFFSLGVGLQTDAQPPSNAIAPGACCFSDGICFDGVEEADCTLIGGAFLGSGLTCDGDPVSAGRGRRNASIPTSGAFQYAVLRDRTFGTAGNVHQEGYGNDEYSE